MRFVGFTIFVLCFIFNRASASGSDSLINFNELSFKNEMEEKVFSDFSCGKAIDSILVFLTPYPKEAAINPDAFKEKINNCVNELQPQLIGKSETKKVKLIYDVVHKTFFKVYKLTNSFCDIFQKGEYNCVSATALYAIIFSKLGIPVQIKEMPTHVFLEAYPGTSKVVLETTAPDKGYYQFSDEIKEGYVKSLSRRKVISKEEMDTTSVAVLFNRYYFSSEDISLIQLAGIQYSNFGIYYNDDRNYSNAVEELKKSYSLYPSERIKFLLKQTLLAQVSNSNYTNASQVKQLVTLCHYNNLKDEEVSNENIKHEFLRVVEAQLIDNSDYAQFDTSYFLVDKALNDSSLKRDIAFAYHNELARLGQINVRDSAYEMKHFNAAYSINPNNANLQGIILAYFANVTEKMSDPFLIMKLIKSYAENFSFLDANEHFNRIRANCTLELSFRSYSYNNILNGDNYIKEFEELYKDNKKVSAEFSFIEKAYSTAASVYFKKGNYARSKQIIKSGLQYAPESFRLKQMLSEF
jgi:hypothetical protein